ncbi:MAG: hypothetical protein HKO92_00260 [Flavobacteriaceae bacterium]|nr:hypothetical protein [Bacteroidia bacterium]NNK81533.1 hypothetical protein [Flavobacteriaceae bacterium]
MFIRVHLTYIVNKNKITGLKERELIIADTLIPDSDNYFTAVKRTVLIHLEYQIFCAIFAFHA